MLDIQHLGAIGVRKMALGRIAAGMEARMPWNIARKIFSDCEIPVGQGWEKSHEKWENFTVTAAQPVADADAKLVPFFVPTEKFLKMKATA